MTRRVQFQRSSITGNIPSRLQAGTPAFNWADQKIHVGGPGDTVDFTISKIDDWDSQLVYRAGDFVVYNGDLWRANVDVPANVGFRESEWTQFTDTEGALVRQNTVTGVISGGATSLIDSRNIQIAAGQGIVVNREDPSLIIVTVVDWGDFSVNFSITPDNSYEIERFLTLDYTGVASFVSNTPTDRREGLFLARLLFENSSLDIKLLQDARTYSARVVDAAEDIVREDTWLHKKWGCIVEPLAALTVQTNSGALRGRDWGSDPKDPNTLSVAAAAPVTFTVARRGDPQYATGQTDIPTEVDTPGGAVGLAAGEATIHRMFVDRSGAFTLVMGQATFSSVSEAVANLWRLQEYTFTELGWDALIDGGAVEIAAIIITPEATDLTDLANARIVNVEGLDQRYSKVDDQDLSNFYRLDGANALTADLSMGGFALSNGFVDGDLVVIQPTDLPSTGEVPVTPVARELQSNAGDAKLFIDNSVVADRVEVYDAARAYIAGDACYSANALYLCLTDTTPGDVPPSASWQGIGSAGGGTGNAIVTEPDTDVRNTIDLVTAGDLIGLTIDPNASQTKDLARFGKAVVDRYGMGRGSFGGQVIRVAQASHGFSAIGQAAAFNNPNWIRADASDATLSGRAIGVVHEVIDANNVNIQIGGTVANLQTAAFAGGSIQVGQVYYADAVSPGLLTNTPPATPNIVDAVLLTVSATEGVQLTSAIIGASGGGSVSGGSTVIAVAQAAHGWTATDIGRPLYLDESDGFWKLAAASALSTAGVAILDSVVDANNVTINMAGYIDDIAPEAFLGAVAPTAGRFYYVDQSTAGQLTELAPFTDENRNAIFLALSATEGIVLPYEPVGPAVAIALETTNTVSTNVWTVAQDDAGDLAIESTDGAKVVVENADPPTKPEALITMGQAFELLYPIGTVYSNGVDGTNPGTLLGFGTWVPYAEGRAMVGVGDIGGTDWTLGLEVGAETHTLTGGEMPSHTHGAGSYVTNTTGSHNHALNIKRVSKGGDSSNVMAYNNDYAPSGALNQNTGSAGNHSHTVSGASGSAGSTLEHNNLQPSVGTYHWIRTA